MAKKLKEMRFFVIDDMQTIRMIVKKTLKDVGVKNLRDFPDAQDAWDFMQKAKGTGEEPEFIVSDWNMPLMSGSELLKKIRADSEYSGIPFIMLTAEGEIENVREAAINGVDAYIVKPFKPGDFKKGLATAYKKRCLNEESKG